MFDKVYKLDTVAVRVRIWLGCEDEGKTEVQVHGKLWETLMVSVSC